MKNTASATPPTPTPGSISYHSVLAQDFITSDGVLVDAKVAGQVGVFRHPTSNAAEALVISSTAGLDQQLFYLRQNTSSLTGWTLDAVLDGAGKAITASQVVGVRNTSGGVDGFYLDLGGTLKQVTLKGSAFTAPVKVSGAPKSLGELRVAYSPGATSKKGTVTLYAGDVNGSIFLYIHRSGAWTAQSMTLGGAASSWTLSLTSDTAWYLTIVAKYNFTFRPNNGQPRGVVKESELAWAKGSFNGGLSVADAGLDTKHTYQEVDFNGTGMAGTSDVMVLGLAKQADGAGGHAVSWLINPHSSTTHGTVAGTSFAHASFVETTDGYVNVYGIDPRMNLFTLRQVAYDPKNMGTGYGQGQTWGPLFQLDARIARMYPEPSTSGTPTLIAVDADKGALHLYVMDPKTHLWLAKPITLPTRHKFEITTWQTDISVYDTNGNPLANYPIAMNAASAMDVNVNGSYHIIDSKQSVQITSNALGKATVSSLATSMAPPALTISGAAIPSQTSHSPGAPINDYLAGTGTILGKPAFSADVVKQLSGDPKIDAAKAHTAIQQCATMGQAAAGDAAARAKLAAQVDQGQAIHLFRRTDSGMAHHTFSKLEHAHAFAAQEQVSAGSIWDDVWDSVAGFAGDVWHAIENGVHAVESFIIDLAKGTVTLLVKIGGAIVQLAEWVIKTVEAGLQAIAAVFNWIKAKIEDVLDWLKMLFDFEAIWNTKKVFSNQLDALISYLLSQINTWSNDFQHGFIDKEKAKIDDYFDQLIAKYEGKSFTKLDGWPGMGQPVSSQPLAGSATHSDLTSNPSANWMQNKVSSHTPSDASTGQSTDGDAISNFFDALINVGEDVLKIFVDLFKGIAALFDLENPMSFQDIVISTFLRVVKDAVDLLLDTFDAVVQAVLALAELAIKGFQAIMQTSLDLGFLNDIYEWITGKSGGEGDLTVGDLICLIAAFPTTIVYKLIAGVDKQPFPGGKPPSPELRKAMIGGAADGGGPSREVAEIFGTVAGVLTVLGAAWTTANDAMDSPPSWIGWASKGTTGLRLVFTHPGFLEWTPLEWASVSAAAANLLWLAPTAYFINDAYNISGKVVGGVEGKLKSSGLTDKGWVFDDLTKLGFSIFGVINLGVVVFNVIEQTDPPLKTTANVVEATVAPFSFVTMKPIKNINIEGVPVGRIAQALKIILDVTAGVGGGALEITSAWTETPHAAGAR